MIVLQIPELACVGRQRLIAAALCGLWERASICSDAIVRGPDADLLAVERSDLRF